MLKVLSKNRILSIALYVLVIEMFLGGSGKIFNIPIRIGILSVLLFFTIIYTIKNDIYIPKNLILGIALLWSYCGIWVIWGGLLGNNIKYALSDITNFFAIIYIVILFVITEGEKKFFLNIIYLLKVSMLILSSVTIILFLSSYIGTFFGLNIGNMIQQFNEKTNYGVITGALYNFKFARVYFAGGLFMQVSLPFFIYDVLNKNRKRDYFFSIILLLGIFSSSTRGYWLGAVVVILMMMIMTNKKQKIKLTKIVVITTLICSPIVFTPFFKNEIADRLISISDFSKDESNKIRTIQKNYLIEKIKEKPMLGSGFGADLKEYELKTGLSGREFELYYLELVYKTGIIGIMLLLIILLFPFYYIGKNIILDKKRMNEEKDVIKALVIGGISSIITGATNPYMQGSIGIFVIVLIITGYFVINRDAKKISIKKSLKFDLF